MNWLKSKVAKGTLTFQNELLINLDNKIRKFKNGTENLTWQDPIANKIISDDSDIVQTLSSNQKKSFMKLGNKMVIPLSDLLKINVKLLQQLIKKKI
jgi:hypothetical protein